LTNQIAALKDKTEAAQKGQAEAKAKAGDAASNFAQAETSLQDDTKALADSKLHWNQLQKAWAEIKATLQAEQQALEQGYQILQGKFGSFLQIAKTTKGYDQRVKASSLLRKLGHKLNSFALLQAAEAAGGEDTFGKVKQLIQDMIMKLEETQRAEATKAAKCKQDIKEGTRDKKIKSQQLAKVSARVDQASAQLKQLADKVNTLQTEIQEGNERRIELSKVRAANKKEHDATTADAKEAIEALGAAITTLTEFYAVDGAEASVGGSTGRGGQLIEILQSALADYQKVKQDTEVAEDTEKKAFEADMQESKVSEAAKTAEREGTLKEISTLKVQNNQHKADKEDAIAAEKSANDYLSVRRQECANKTMSHEQRQAARSQEIAGLKNALEILSAPDTA